MKYLITIDSSKNEFWRTHWFILMISTTYPNYFYCHSCKLRWQLSRVDDVHNVIIQHMSHLVCTPPLTICISWFCTWFNAWVTSHQLTQRRIWIRAVFKSLSIYLFILILSIYTFVLNLKKFNEEKIKLFQTSL